MDFSQLNVSQLNVLEKWRSSCGIQSRSQAKGQMYMCNQEQQQDQPTAQKLDRNALYTWIKEEGCWPRETDTEVVFREQTR